MNLYILDTDHLSLSQHGHPTVLSSMNSMPTNAIATTIINVEEQIRGRFNSIKRANTKERLVRAYFDFQATLIYFSHIQILPYTEFAYDHFMVLRKQKIRIGTQDLRIASIALAHHATIVTRNQRDFSKVPNLMIQDWLEN